jgi:hypothetical protein
MSGVELLIKAGLYGAGLVEISTSVLVDRYNGCLERLGIEPTKLTRFHIDGVGWSPEVAKEKGDNLYLSHGIPNQMAVILTPDQRKRPIYFKFNSFERRMIDTFFERFEAEIADITSTNGIALSIDQGLTELSSLQDLLLIDHVTLRASTNGDLTEQAQHQKQLIERFMEGEAWFDPELRASIVQSAKAVGDLRSRQVEIPEMQFDDLRSFFSVALGGVFVIRTDPGIDDLLVVQEKEALGAGKRIPKNMLWISDPKLVDRLLDTGLLDINFEWFRENPKDLDYKMECLAVDALASTDDGIDFGKLTPILRKKMLVGIRNKMPSTYFELERLKKMLEQKAALPDREDLSRETLLTLIHPSGNLKPWYREVIWQIICRLTQYDPLRLYIADRNRFFAAYETWPASKQAWATNLIKRLYKPHRGGVPEEELS